MNEKKEWVFCDPHYHHRKLVEEGIRPEGFEQLVSKSWQTVVQPEDTVYCLGDICLGDKVKVHDQYIKPMPGYKILIKGNHDKEKDSWYLSNGWDEVYDQLRIKRPWRVLLSHQPQPDDNTFDINIHAHFHNNRHRKFPNWLTSKHRLLALECVNYKLVSLQDFIDGKIEQPGLPTDLKLALDKRF